MSNKENYDKPLLYGIIDELKKYNKFTEEMENIREKRRFLEGLFFGVDIQEGKTSVAVSPFKFEKAPHLSDYLDMDFNIKETVTIMKGVSLGATTCISDNYFEIINRHEREQNQKKLDLAMEDLKSKYPDYIFGSLLKSKNHGIIILDEAVDISEIEPLDSIVGVKRASDIRKKFMLPILGDK